MVGSTPDWSGLRAVRCTRTQATVRPRLALTAAEEAEHLLPPTCSTTGNLGAAENSGCISQAAPDRSIFRTLTALLLHPHQVSKY
jgi:hypothetical protein